MKKIKTGVIKEVKRGNFKLKHSRHIGSFGFYSDHFELIEVRQVDPQKGLIICYPFTPPMKVNPLNPNYDIRTVGIVNFSNKEYEAILSEEILKVEKYYQEALSKTKK